MVNAKFMLPVIAQVPRAGVVPWSFRVLAGVLALSCLAAALGLAVHHPLSGNWAVAGVLLAAGLAAGWPLAWLVALPALLPWLGLAPWTGWISVEETDLLVMALAAGTYGRWALRPLQLGQAGPGLAGLVALLLFGLWAGSVLISLQRGVADAGGLMLDWYQAYRGPMNALRLAKPSLMVALIWPLWWCGLRQTHGQAAERLTLGLAMAHAGIALTCLWERWTYPGLLNFSADYRTTGLFWEMHVGGATLDGLLTLTMPFALKAWLEARSRTAWLMACATLLVGGYAVLTTFSRILLLAVPLGLGLTALLHHRNRSLGALRPDSPSASDRARPLMMPRAALALVLWLAVSAAAILMFSSSGYRGLMALLGNAALLLILAPAARQLGRREWVVTLVGVLVFAPALLLVAWQLPKGPYVMQGLLWLVATAGIYLARNRNIGLVAALIAWAEALACMVELARFWGGTPAQQPALMAAAGLALLMILAVSQPHFAWPADRRWQGGVWIAMLASAAVIGVFTGGAYMGERMGASTQDQEGRLSHWRTALSALHSDQSWWLGLGLGRFLEAYAINADIAKRPGDLRWIEADGQRFLRMAPGGHMMGWGELLRLSQRIDRPSSPLRLQISLRHTGVVRLHVEVCLRHLLYAENCQVAAIDPKAGHEAWQTLSVSLGDLPWPVDDWARPRFTVFSLAVERAEQPVEVRSLSLRDDQGHEYLHNGGFDAGGQRWFFSSDRNHLPWHAKNVLVHLLLEQGMLGLVSLALLSAWAFWRVTLGGARRHGLAPALAGGLLGLWAVGAVDSLLDMPRLALPMLWLTVVAASLPRPAPPRRLGLRFTKTFTITSSGSRSSSTESEQGVHSSRRFLC